MEKPSLPPLFGWDLLLETHQRIREAGQDLQALSALAARNGWQQELDFHHRLLTRQDTIIVTNIDIQIVFASRNMTGMNGYLPEEVIGKTPAMFQGPQTDPKVRAQIRAAISAFNPFSSVLNNYRKDGSLYACRIDAFPLLDRSGKPVHFVAFESVVELG